MLWRTYHVGRADSQAMLSDVLVYNPAAPCVATPSHGRSLTVVIWVTAIAWASGLVAVSAGVQATRLITRNHDAD